MTNRDLTYLTDEQLLELRAIHRTNLADLELQAAKFTDQYIPAPLQNEIDDYQQHLAAIAAAPLPLRAAECVRPARCGAIGRVAAAARSAGVAEASWKVGAISRRQATRGRGLQTSITW